MTTLKIPAKSFKRFDDPFAEQNTMDKPVKYHFYARVTDIPEELLNWMDTNPRSQSLKTDVSRAIQESLLDDANPRFHLWNRGILISAEKATFDNRSGIVELVLSDYTLHGSIDGGHTLRIILECRKVAEKEGASPPNQYVDVEVITGLDTPDALAEARNTSVAVDLKSMEELRKSFDVLKEILEPEYIEGNHYIKRVEFRQNQMRAQEEKNAIDVREVLSIINMFNQTLYPNIGPNSLAPIQSFSGKEVGLKKFLQGGLGKDADDDECRAAREEILKNMAPVIPGIFRLWDYIERHFAEATSQIGKRYGTKSYSNHDKTSRPNAMFSNTALRYTIPKGLMYPLVGSFRALIERDPETGDYFWAVDPIDAWHDLKATLSGLVMSTSEELANNPANVGRSAPLWNSLFLTVFVYATQHQK